MELTEEQKQDLVKFRQWVKEHPVIKEVFSKHSAERFQIMRARLAKFQLHKDVLTAIVEYANEEFLFGYYVGNMNKEG